MDFLRRLAAPTPGDTTRAVPALPARFWVERPLRTPLPVLTPEGEAGDVGLGDGQRPIGSPREVGVARGRSARTEAKVLTGEEPQRGIPPSSTRMGLRQGRSGSVQPRGTPQEILTTQAPARSSAMAPQELPERSRQAGPSDHGVSFPLATNPSRAADPVPAPVQASTVPRPLTSPPQVGQSRVAPLSRAALAARQVHRPEQRPVIQVTIDRIEVRAPASTPHPATPQKPRAMPGVSLSDYLRGREESR